MIKTANLLGESRIKYRLSRGSRVSDPLNLDAIVNDNIAPSAYVSPRVASTCQNWILTSLPNSITSNLNRPIG